jgi:hypothetical protein
VICFLLLSFQTLFENIVLMISFFLTGYADPDADGGLEQDLASRRYRALMPDEEYYSDEY